MTTISPDLDLRLIRALRRRWPDRDERAAALGLSTRQLQRWELDGDIPQIICRLAELGIIEIAEDHLADPAAEPADVSV